MALSLEVTGILGAAAFWVRNKGGINGKRLYFYFYLLLTGISMVIGNDPVICECSARLGKTRAVNGSICVSYQCPERYSSCSILRSQASIHYLG